MGIGKTNTPNAHEQRGGNLQIRTEQHLSKRTLLREHDWNAQPRRPWDNEKAVPPAEIQGNGEWEHDFSKPKEQWSITSVLSFLSEGKED